MVPAIELPVHIAAMLKYSFLLIKFNIKSKSIIILLEINIDGEEIIDK